MTDDDYLKCEYCGKQDGTVSRRINLYHLELHGKEISEDVCKECHKEHLLDI